MKRLRKWVLGIAAAAVVLMGAGVSAGYYFQDEVEAYMVNQLNRRLNTKIHVDKINLSVLRKFPYAALEFDNIWAEDAWIKVGQRDSLFFFEHAWIQFSIADLISKDYKIRKLSIEHGAVHLKVDSEGMDNYHFWTNETQDSDSGYLDLSDIQANHILFEYRNLHSEDSIAIDIEAITASGMFAADDYDMALTGVVHNQYLSIGGENYLPDKDVAINTKLRIDKTSRSYRLAPSNMVVENDLDFDLAGRFEAKEKAHLIDLQISGKKINLSKAVRLLPPPVLEHLSEFEFDGMLSFEGTVKGRMGDGHYPTYSSSFSLTGATIRNKKLDVSFHDVATRGRISADQLQFDALSVGMGNSQFDGSAEVRNFKAPILTVNCRGMIDMKDLKRFTGGVLDTLSGKGDLLLAYVGPMKMPSDWSMPSLSEQELSITGNLTNVSAHVHKGHFNIRSAGGNVEVKGNDLACHKMTFDIDGTHCRVDGLFRELLNAVNDSTAPLVFEGLLDVDQLNIDAEKEDPSYALPDRVHLNVKTSINELHWEDIAANHVSAIISGNADLFHIKLMGSSAFGGKLKGILDAQRTTNGWQTAGTLNAVQIDIQQLFRECKNFDQQFITERHLRGRSNIDMQYQTTVNGSFAIVPSSFKAHASVHIWNGALIGLESMDAISDYIAEHKLLNVFVKADEMRKKLSDIRFSDLSNTIDIENRTVCIPQMTLTSSAIKLVADGEHDFDNHFTYHYHFKVSEILTRKSKTPTDYQVPIIKDETVKGVRLYFTLSGTPDNFEVTHDMKAQLRGMKEQAHNEKQITKSILNKEFGLFKGDSTLPSLQSLEKPPPDFSITWEEDPDTLPAHHEDHETQDSSRWGQFLRQLKKEGKGKSKKKDLFTGDDY